jgi:hypothetical protein
MAERRDVIPGTNVTAEEVAAEVVDAHPTEWHPLVRDSRPGAYTKARADLIGQVAASLRCGAAPTTETEARRQAVESFRGALFFMRKAETGYGRIDAVEPASAPTEPAPAPSEKRLNVKMSEAAYVDLQRFAEATDRTISDVVRHALALELWWERNKREHNRVLLETPKGQVREVVGV